MNLRTKLLFFLSHVKEKIKKADLTITSTVSADTPINI